ncbi:hypothetical protein ACFQBY_18695 [Promicromonospora citrea]|uniref:hypothetical protein n=1 Tax=Promicromonospora citrea TaxID=43677 RepID=UPI001488E247|nr:hypothetical protein [Promicromonospora citrea]NNH52357.1 hypothetical protein [Promicromonospora citrea]
MPVPGPRPVVWAPRARVIEVLVPYDAYEEPEHMPLRLVGAGQPGYWGADTVLGHGTDYGYSVDGGPLLPDPRSVWLPQGIHGPTRVFDPAFEWTDGTWSPPDLSTSVLMHVDVETFTPEGTLDAAARLLPAVAELGVHGVELAPVAAFDPALGPSHGVRLYSVHEPYGGPRALQRFVDAAHAAGLAVVLDIPYRWAVADELGLEAYGPYLQGGGRPRPPRPDVGDAGEHALQAMRPRTGQVPLDRPRTGPIQMRTGQVPSIGTRAGKVPSAPTVRTDYVGDRINLDGSGSRGPRDFLVDDARHWLREYHVDGLVLDVDALVDRSPTPFLGELADHVVALGEQLDRRFSLLVDGPGRSDRLTSILLRILSGPGKSEDIQALQMLADLVHPSVRRASRQNGGGRRRMRSGAAVVEDITRLPATQLTVPWAGEESPATALLAVDDVDIRASVLATVVLAGNPLVLDTVHTPVAPRNESEQRLARWARELIAIRHSVAEELDLPLEIRSTADRSVIVVLRGTLAFVLNTGHGLAALRLGSLLRPADGAVQAPLPGSFRLAAAWEPGATRLVGDTLTVPPRMTAVLRAENPTHPTTRRR